MSSPGGGGINLPPLNQQINVGVSGAGSAQGMFNSVLRGAGGASSAVGGLTSQLGGMNRSMMNTVPTWRGAGDAMRMTGSIMQYKIAMPLLAIGKGAIKASVEFETAMTKIKGLVGLSTGEVAKMSSAILEMAGSVAKGPTELADALYFITSAGQRGAQALDTLKVSAQAASAGLGTVKSVADLTTSVMNSYSPGLYDATVATDTLVAAVREGKAAATDFAPAMGKVLPIAAAFGVKFQDVAASVASLTREGTPAGTAAIQLRQILGSILKPTSDATKELNKYGLSTQELRKTIQEKGLFAGFQQLHGALGDNAEAMSHVFGNIRPLTAISALLGPSMAKNAAIFGELNNAAGSTQKATEEMQKTLGYKMNAASAEGKVALIRVGDAIAPLIKKMADVGKAAAEVFSFIGRNETIVRFGASIAALAIGFTMFTRTLATFIRLKAFTTVALQGLANGFRDQNSGVVTNILTGRQYNTQQAQTVAATTRTTAAVAGGIGPMQALAMTMEDLRATLAQMVSALQQNTVVTAENTNAQINLAAESGVTTQTILDETNAVLGGGTAMAEYAAVTETAATVTGELAGVTAAAAESAAVLAGAIEADVIVEAEAIGVSEGLTTATLVGVQANLQQQQTIMTKIKATMAAIFADRQLVVAEEEAAVASKTMAAGMASTMAMTGGMIAGMMLLTYAVQKGITMFSHMNKKVMDTETALGSLTDAASNFRIAPIVVGANIEFINANGNNGSNTNLFENFITGVGATEDKAKEAGATVKKTLDEFRIQVGKGALSEERKLQLAIGFSAKMGGDVHTRDNAISYFTSFFGVKDRNAVAAGVNKASQDVSSLYQAAYSRTQSEIAKNRDKSAKADITANAQGGGFGEITPQLSASATSLSGYMKDVTSNTSSASDAIYLMTKDIADSPGLISPLKDSLDATIGSSFQFVGGLKEIYEAAKSTGKGTKFASNAVNLYAKEALKAQGIDVKGKNISEMLMNGYSSLGGEVKNYTAQLLMNTDGTWKAAMANESLLLKSDKLIPTIKAMAGDFNALSAEVTALENMFTDGFNPVLNDTIQLADATAKAVKGIKDQQDLLFGASKNAAAATSGFQDSLGKALKSTAKTHGEFASGTADAEKAKTDLVGLSTSLQEVYRSVFETTPGSPTDKKAAADAYVKAVYKDMIDALVSNGADRKKIQAAFDTFIAPQATPGAARMSYIDAVTNTGGGNAFTSAAASADAASGGKDVGGSFQDGTMKGLESKNKDMSSTAVDSVKQMVADVKKYLEIKSPSQVMFRVGVQMGEGLKQGAQSVLGTLPETVSGSAKDAVNATKAVASAANFRKFEGFNPGGKNPKTDTPKPPPGSSLFPTPGSLTGVSADTTKTSKADATKALAATIKMHGSTVSKGVYDLMATTLSGKSAKDLGGAFLTKFAEGVNAAKSLIKTPITDLLKSITSEVTSKLTTFKALIDAQINFDQAKVDLKKFLVLNTTELLNASISAATRAKSQAANKFGGNQGTDVTRYEKSQIQTAKATAQQAARDYRLGKISFAEYQDAQDALVNTQAAASEASSELAQKTNDLTDAEAAKESAAGRTASAAAAVVLAQDTLTNAWIAANTAGGDLKDTFNNIANVVIPGLAGSTSSYFSGIASIVNPAIKPFISPDMSKLITGANTEAATGSLVNTPTTPAVSATPTDTGMSFDEGRRAFLKIVNDQFDPKPKWKNVSEYENAGGASRKAGRVARWEQFMIDNKVAAKAKGGSLSPGRLTLVGESGPELITPNSAARITPYSVLEQYARTASHNGSQGGSQGSSNPINITVNNPVPERASDSIARRMQNMSSLGLFG